MARQNYAITAMNAWFERELRKLNYPDLQIVPAFDIIAPRLQFGLHNCACHFLCHQDRAWGILETAEGVAVAKAIQRAICSLPLDHKQ
jgi:hypothetical protein